MEFLAEKTRGQNSPRYEYANTLQTALFLCRDAAMTTLRVASHVFVPGAVANDSRLDLVAAADLRCTTRAEFAPFGTARAGQSAKSFGATITGEVMRKFLLTRARSRRA